MIRMPNEIARIQGRSDLQDCFTFDACPCQKPFTVSITISSLGNLSLPLLLQDEKATTGAQWASNTPINILGSLCGAHPPFIAFLA